MSEIERFNKEASDNKEMLEELKKIGNDIEEIVKYANLKGYKFTVEEISALTEADSDELSEDDLENVSGGAVAISSMPIISVIVGVVSANGLILGQPNIPHRK